MSEEEFISDADIVRMTNLLDDVLSDYQEKLQDAQISANVRESAFFKIGVKLVEVNKEIQRQEPDKKGVAKSKFAALKINVSAKLGKNRSNIDKVVKVAEFCETPHYAKYENRLPNGWSSLYLISSYDEKKLDKLMENSEINAGISRAELAKKLDKKPKKIIYGLKIISPNRMSKKEIDLFKDLIDTNDILKGWTISPGI
jgi:hypothetical protein